MLRGPATRKRWPGPITRAALSCRRVVPFVVDLATNRKDTRVSEESDRVIIVRLVELAYTKITDSGDNPQAWPAEAVDALAEAVESTGRLEDEHGEPALLRLKEDLRAMGDHRAELLLAAMAFIGNDIAKEV